jgi:hypothetical protein
MWFPSLFRIQFNNVPVLVDRQARDSRDDVLIHCPPGLVQFHGDLVPQFYAGVVLVHLLPQQLESFRVGVFFE